MTILHGLIPGAVQGIAEWLPVSSKGIVTLILVNAFGFLAIGALMKVAIVMPFWIFCIALGLLSLAPWLLGL